MEGLKVNKRLWRMAGLALLVAAAVGPWGFDRIMVPAEYTCEAPFIRLEGDFCGTPLSGIWLFIGGVLEFARQAAGLATGAKPLEEWASVARVGGLTALVWLPLVSTLAEIVRADGRGRTRLHVVALGLGAGTAVYFGLQAGAGFAMQLWGVWLYAGAAVAGLGVEVAWAGRGAPMD